MCGGGDGLVSSFEISQMSFNSFLLEYGCVTLLAWCVYMRRERDLFASMLQWLHVNYGITVHNDFK